MLRDSAREYTDRKLNDLEKELEREYSRALDEVREKWNAYMKEFTARGDELLKSVRDAERAGDAKAIAKARAAYTRYMQNATFQNMHYRELTDRISNDLAHIDQAAYRLANNLLPDIYAVNYNSLAERLPTGYAFGLVDSHTVQNLLYKDLNLLKDARWNQQRLNSEILQGILQGESIPKIAKRLAPMIDGNKAAAIRNARTAVTYAENQGRLDSMKEAYDEGIILAKEWIATEDSRTRDSHRELDGAVIGIDEKFANGLDCPGDPEGDAAEVYNCRCTLGEIIVGFRRDDGGIQYTAEGEKYRGRFD